MQSSVLIRDAANGQWLSFSEPYKIHCVSDGKAVLDALAHIEKDIIDHRLWAAGWLSYEASSAFDESLKTHAATDFPLLWFGLFKRCDMVFLDALVSDEHVHVFQSAVWSINSNLDDYSKIIEKIKHEIRQGNSYQVNYTIRQYADMDMPPEDVFLGFAAQAKYGAFIDAGRYALCSASPELFFQIEDNVITSKPMKGTAPRGRYFEEDNYLRDELHASQKNRAENLMIVDMIRNDIGRIAQAGSVTVPHLFEIEKYPTVWQMTSTVTARLRSSLVEIFSALYPCASITGAPKANTMKIIHDLETSARNIYTGTIGFIRPDMSMQFNVAIRTVLIDKQFSQAEYGVGGGIVWDSCAQGEYDECLTKSTILSGKGTYTHKLLETMLYSPDDGYFLLDYHFRRLTQSARYFAYKLDLKAIEKSLVDLDKSGDKLLRVRLLSSKNGDFDIQCAELATLVSDSKYTLKLAQLPIDENDIYLYHKTTQRKVYNYYQKLYPQFNDVLLLNKKGELTESCIANLVVKIRGKMFTPPISCGLLNGTYRQYLLDEGEVTELKMTKQLLENADAVYLINSVRKMFEVEIIY